MKLAGISEEGMQKVAKTIKGQDDSPESSSILEVRAEIRDFIDDLKDLAGEMEAHFDEAAPGEQGNAMLYGLMNQAYDMELPGLNAAAESIMNKLAEMD